MRLTFDLNWLKVETVRCRQTNSVFLVVVSSTQLLSALECTTHMRLHLKDMHYIA